MQWAKGELAAVDLLFDLRASAPAIARQLADFEPLLDALTLIQPLKLSLGLVALGPKRMNEACCAALAAKVQPLKVAALGLSLELFDAGARPQELFAGQHQLSSIIIGGASTRADAVLAAMLGHCSALTELEIVARLAPDGARFDQFAGALAACATLSKLNLAPFDWGPFVPVLEAVIRHPSVSELVLADRFGTNALPHPRRLDGCEAGILAVIREARLARLTVGRFPVRLEAVGEALTHNEHLDYLRVPVRDADLEVDDVFREHLRNSMNLRLTSIDFDFVDRPDPVHSSMTGGILKRKQTYRDYASGAMKGLVSLLTVRLAEGGLHGLPVEPTELSSHIAPFLTGRDALALALTSHDIYASAVVASLAQDFKWQIGQPVTRSNLSQFAQMWCQASKAQRLCLDHPQFGDGVDAEGLLNGLHEADNPLGIRVPGDLPFPEPELRLLDEFRIVAPGHDAVALKATLEMRSRRQLVPFPVEVPKPGGPAGSAEDALRHAQPLLWRAAARSITEVHISSDKDICVVAAAAKTPGCPSLAHLSVHIAGLLSDTGRWALAAAAGKAGLRVFKLYLDSFNSGEQILHEIGTNEKVKGLHISLEPSYHQHAAAVSVPVSERTAMGLCQGLADVDLAGLDLALWQFPPSSHSRLVEALRAQPQLERVQLQIASQADIDTAERILRECPHITTFTLTRPAGAGRNLTWAKLSKALAQCAALTTLTLDHVLDQESLCALIAAGPGIQRIDAPSCRVNIGLLGEALQGQQGALRSLQVRKTAEDSTEIDVFVDQLGDKKTIPLIELDLGSDFNARPYEDRDAEDRDAEEAGDVRINRSQHEAIRMALLANLKKVVAWSPPGEDSASDSMDESSQ
jgi:hypothetical protein